MTELISATLLEQPKIERSANTLLDYSTETIGKLEVGVLDLLEANGIDPNSVLFSGYTIDNEKTSVENSMYSDDNLPVFFFGNAMSLAPPQSFSDDELVQDDHWSSNPLRFASNMQGKYGPYSRLAIYDKRMVEDITGGQYEAYYMDDKYEPDDYGTYTYAIAPRDLKKAQLAEIHFRSSIDTEEKPEIAPYLIESSEV